MKQSLCFTLGFIFVLLIISCKQDSKQDEQQPDDAFAHIQDVKVQSILRQAIAKSGGWDSYDKIDSITYTKKTILYLPDGAVETESLQQHFYQLKPNLVGRILSQIGADTHETYFDTNESYKMKNGVKVPGSEASARSSFLSAYYVLFVPFKLLDPGTELSFAGIDTLSNGSVVNTIKATYSPEKHSNHSTADDWYFYFDINDGTFLSNMVYHAPTYALINNDEVSTDHPIRLNTYRKSYRTDADRNIEYLRGEFWYSNYNVTLR